MTQQTKQITKNKTENKMREVEIEKMVINCGGIDDKFERSVKLLEMLTGKKVYKIQSRKRIPAFGISPGKQSGCKVTLRNIDEINILLRRLFAAIDNKISEKKITDNNVSFHIVLLYY